LFATIDGTITPWLLGGLILLVLLTLSITVKSWRETKRSPYFFLRVQAAKRMQRYMAATGALILLTAVTSAYAWQAPQDDTPRVALLRHAKIYPVETTQKSTILEAEASPEAVVFNLAPGSSRAARDAEISPEADLLNPLNQSSTLPEEYDQYKPTAELTDETDIGELAFSTGITGDYGPVDPGLRFVQGYFTLYATFEYQDMADGMVWSWIWRYNGQVVDGGNQVWSYGDEGPGYIYFRPEEGFGLGNYDLEVWVNQELMSRANFTVTESVAANN
jgi:hypothetical protein